MGFPEAMRVSVGVASENNKLLAVLAALLAKRHGKSELTAR
jgi:histidinol-phosphate/aromatic aminotransferase/cobyric acid decarboxylase-like protein